MSTFGSLMSGDEPKRVLLPQGSTLYRAGHMGWQKKLAFFGITEAVAQNYVRAHPDQKRKIFKYKTQRPLYLRHFKGQFDIERFLGAQGVMFGNNPAAARILCGMGADGWYVRNLEHYIGDQEDYEWDDLMMHEVMLCDLTSATIKRIR